MCGITGVILETAYVAPDEMVRRLEAMTAEIRHRGPDGGRVAALGRVGLGHRRLAVIDLEDRASQPMSTADGKLWIVFNGEIYNFKELRAQLVQQGYIFRTESDTEVILHGWRAWREGVVARLRGMFAFALWDADAEQMLLARDRFGKKPLFYSDQPGAFLFASEIKAMLQWPGFARQANLDVIHDYLTYRYCVGRDSAFVGVKKLPPAHFMVLEKGRPQRLVRYWVLANVDPSQAGRSTDDLAHELVERLDEAIACRLISDVPLGAFLSGGVDSSAIVARMSKLASERVKTFSVGFAIEGYDETPYAAEVAHLFDTEHRAFTMDYGLVRDLPRLIWHYGEPYADSSALVTFALAREMRRYVTVGLSGDGGDEIFLGYSRYNRFKSMVERFHAGRREKLPYDPLLGEDRGDRIRDHYARSISVFREEHKLAGYGDALIDQLFVSSIDRLGLGLEGANSGDAIDAVARLEVGTYLPDDLLVKADIATMAVGLESRSPFLDHQLADWGASLPQAKRVFERAGELEMKGLLKLAFEGELPGATLYRPKQGFAVPVAHWIKFEIRDFLYETLTSRRFRERGLITAKFLERMMSRHFSGLEDHGTRLWTLLCLELWYRTFIDAEEVVPLDVDVFTASRPVELELTG